jgi:hypothetical protein
MTKALFVSYWVRTQGTLTIIYDIHLAESGAIKYLPLAGEGLLSLILSVDLAYKSYEDFGMCLLGESTAKVSSVRYVAPGELGLCGLADPQEFSNAILDFGLMNGVSIIMLDGPQGWKDPANGLLHQRLCERNLNTAAKTGTYGNVKPANYRPFVSFAIEVFRQLHREGAHLVTSEVIEVPPDGLLVVKTYPRSAWKTLSLQPLPGKKKSPPDTVRRQACYLKDAVGLPEIGRPNHDQLSALVAGLGGVAILAHDRLGYATFGAPPTLTPEGHLVEGYIVNPRQKAC